MSAAHPRHWAGIGETTWVRGIRLLCAVHDRLGRWPFRLCVWPVVLGHWLLHPLARRASLQYLRRQHAYFQRPGPVPGRWQSLRHFFRFAETLLDKLLAVAGRYPATRVRLQRDVMLAQLRQGRGGVIVTAHLGCLELCQALAPEASALRLIVLVHTAHAERFNRLLHELAPQGRVELLQVTQLDPAVAARLAEAVAGGAFVAIAGDRVPLQGGRSVPVRFLGHEACFPIGPYVLAGALACPLFAMACVREGQGYRISFELLAERVRLARGTREAELRAQAGIFVRWIEAQLRESALDWFNFFPFWDQADHDPSKF